MIFMEINIKREGKFVRIVVSFVLEFLDCSSFHGHPSVCQPLSRIQGCSKNPACCLSSNEVKRSLISCLLPHPNSYCCFLSVGLDAVSFSRLQARVFAPVPFLSPQTKIQALPWITHFTLSLLNTRLLRISSSENSSLCLLLWYLKLSFMPQTINFFSS